MHTLTEKIGIVNEAISFMQNSDNKTALAGKNFDPAPHITRLQGKLANFTQLSAEQKELDVEKQNKTRDMNAAGYDTYNDTSGVIDAMMGLLGKGTIPANKLQTIRSKVRKHDDANPQPPTTGAKA